MVYVTEPGEEYYMHMFLWRVVPFSFKLGAEIESVDLTLKKVQKTNDHDCVKNYDYMGKQYFSLELYVCIYLCVFILAKFYKLIDKC